MDTQSWLYHLSIRSVLIGAFGSLMAVSVIGQKLGHRGRQRGTTREPSDFLPSTVLALAALLLSFTLSLAIGRYEERRQLEISEANAIGTAYLRSRLMEQPRAKALGGLMRGYLDERIAYYSAADNRAAADSAKSRSHLFENRIWDQVVGLTRAQRGPLEGVFVAAVNEMFDVGNQRTLALEKSLPFRLYWLILLVAAVGVGSYSFNIGYRQGRLRNPAILLTLFSLLLALIVDLDRPHAGGIRLGQEALLEIRAEMGE